jgi:predicted unusual protein kinase regulating ubiquinone biosynthesis (AarF/ABC1/UbiB family)
MPPFRVNPFLPSSSISCRLQPHANFLLRKQLLQSQRRHIRTDFDFRISRGRIDAALRQNRTLWKWVLILGTATSIVGVVSFTDTGRHYAGAVQRSYRVAETLAVCIYDYRTTLKREDDSEEYAEELKACHRRSADRTLKAMEKNGSIFVKLGQHLSSLTYLLPKEWCDAFVPLQDKCPVSSLDSIRDMVLKDTGRSLEGFFSEFEALPIGAASLAQVHRAVIRETGERVAVKLQHPALDEWAPLDLALTRFTFESLKYWFPEYDLTWLAEEMEASLPVELDFNHEAKNAMRAREYFADFKDAPVVIPRVLWAQRRILVMEYITGHRPDDLEYLDSHGIDRDEVSAALARIFNEMIFGTDAPLHCDPHGGNIAIRHRRRKWNERHHPNFDVILYDHGLYRDLPLALRRSYAKLWLAVLDSDLPRMRTYAKEVAGIDDAHFELFASAITGRDYSVLAGGGGVQKPRDNQEKKAIGQALGEGLLADLTQLLGKMPRVLLLVLKTNDLSK